VAAISEEFTAAGSMVNHLVSEEPEGSVVTGITGAYGQGVAHSIDASAMVDGRPQSQVISRLQKSLQAPTGQSQTSLPSSMGSSLQLYQQAAHNLPSTNS
jgi:hypothetical protein